MRNTEYHRKRRKSTSVCVCGGGGAKWVNIHIVVFKDYKKNAAEHVYMNTPLRLIYHLIERIIIVTCHESSKWCTIGFFSLFTPNSDPNAAKKLKLSSSRCLVLTNFMHLSRLGTGVYVDCRQISKYVSQSSHCKSAVKSQHEPP